MGDDTDLVGKRVFLKLHNGRVHNGLVKKHENNLIKIIDIKGDLVFISEEEIAYLKVEDQR